MAPKPQPGEPNIFGHRKPTAEQENLEAKREYNIKLREQKYNVKQTELSALRKQKKLRDAENLQKAKQAEAMKRQQNLNAGLAKKQHNMEDDYRERNRDAAIARREERWQTKMHDYLTRLLDNYQDQLDSELEVKTNAKQKVGLQAKADAKSRAEKAHQNEALEEQRAEAIRKGTQKRLATELVHCEELKQEIEEEIEYKLECIEQGISTKVTMNDMVKSLVPVPAISELFCAVKSELDEIKHLKQVELEPLANLAGLPPLMYVKQLNEEHEKNKLPIPSAVQVQQQN